MMILSLGLILLPLIPGLRDIPRWVPVHRLIWRDYYRSYTRDGSPRGPAPNEQPEPAAQPEQT